MKDATRNLMWRVLAAAVLLPPVLLAVLWQRDEALALLLHVAVLIASLEFFSMTLSGTARWLRWCAALTSAAVSVVLFWWPDMSLSLLVATTVLIATVNLIGTRDVNRASKASAWMLWGIFYVGVLLTTIGRLKQMPMGEQWVLLALMITWMSDTGAYFVGRSLGRRKLCPGVSPNKTVEGAIGGLFAALLAAAIAKIWLLPVLSWFDACLLGLIAGAFAQMGDLVESMFKRAFSVKDSGNLIPGHGGLLDRIDALLFAGPVIYLYVTHVASGM